MLKYKVTSCMSLSPKSCWETMHIATTLVCTSRKLEIKQSGSPGSMNEVCAVISSISSNVCHGHDNLHTILCGESHLCECSGSLKRSPLVKAECFPARPSARSQSPAPSRQTHLESGPLLLLLQTRSHVLPVWLLLCEFWQQSRAA